MFSSSQRIFSAQRLLLAVLLVAVWPFPAKKKEVRFYRKPDQVAEMPPPSLVAARPCGNWAWAAGVESMLKSLSIDLPQKFWVTRANGGEVCIAKPPDPAEFNHFIDGDYALADGRRIRLESRLIPREQIVLDDLIAALQGGQPKLLFWNNHPYLLYGMLYDENIGPGGVRRYYLKELRLLDLTFADPQRRKVTFSREKDDISGITGILEIKAAPRGLFELKK